MLQVARPVSWTEPQFTDNVKIEHVMARLKLRLIQIKDGNNCIKLYINQLTNCIFSALPGSDMGLGKHLVIYQAADEAKNKEKCVFTITVVQFKQEHPGRKYVVLSNLIAGKMSRVFLCLSTRDISVSTGGCCVGSATQGGRLGCSCQR